MDKRGLLMIRTSDTEQDVRLIFCTPVLKHKITDPDLLLLPFEEGDENTGVSLSYRLLKGMGGLLSFNKEDDHIVLTITLPKVPERVSGVGPQEDGG
jgi:two-component system, NtrC family, sensor histidine kinase HydH